LSEESSLFSLHEPALAKMRFSLRRSRLEIRMDILSCIRSGAEKPTQIMYKANLSWIALKDHLSALEEGKLLSVVEYGNRKKYELTEKAFAVLVSYSKVLQEITGPAERTAATF